MKGKHVHCRTHTTRVDWHPGQPTHKKIRHKVLVTLRNDYIEVVGKNVSMA